LPRPINRKREIVMGSADARQTNTGKWLALTAALLGWMFDGLEMGLFPLVARPALKDLHPNFTEQQVGLWFGVATAAFLVGAATGGVLFGWLGDRLGRVRAMTLSVVTYAILSGLCGFTTAAWQIAVLRFLAGLGMGGEWSLGVALVVEIWPNRSRAFLAGLIGAAANVGYMLIAVVGLGLGLMLHSTREWFLAAGMAPDWADWLTAHSGWRMLMFSAMTPALLTFFIIIFVPESGRWQHERDRGATSNWMTADLLGVLIGSGAAVGIIALWAVELPLLLRIPGTLAGLVVVTLGYLYPMIRYLGRSDVSQNAGVAPIRAATLRRMLLGAALSGVALLGTWASIQWAPAWADQLTSHEAEAHINDHPAASAAIGLSGSKAFVQAAKKPEAKSYTQFWSALGAVVGCLLGAMLGDWLGRRWAYTLLCLGALGSSLLFFLGNTHFGVGFLASVFLAGGLTASFYGWLPLYLPELFNTRVRATGQGFSFNFGRILAAVGALQVSNLMQLFEGGYPEACSIMSLIYVVGMVLIWLAPETRGKPLPE
jgi:MFS family permease